MKENSLKMGQNKMIEKVFCGPLKNYISMVEKKKMRSTEKSKDVSKMSGYDKVCHPNWVTIDL